MKKLDGSGYPNGLKGVEIPLSTRVLCIADAVDSLTTAKPYKNAWKTNDAFDYIQD